MLTRLAVTKTMRLVAALVSPGMLAACGGSQRPAEPGPIQPSGVYQMPAPPGGEPAPVANETDAPEISRSVGEPGSVVVLWPRIVLARGAAGPDAETRAVARRAQERLGKLVQRARAGAVLDVRPEPERVCPREGCSVPSVGILLERVGNGCALIALSSRSGTSSATLTPWVGRMTLDAPSVPFREAPERVVHVKDFSSCPTLLDDTSQEAAIVEAIRAAIQ